MRIAVTRHAAMRLESRGLQFEWIERTIRDPERRETDPVDPTLTRLFRRIPEVGGRVIRVVLCFSSKTEECRLVTAFLDRDAEV